MKKNRIVLFSLVIILLIGIIIVCQEGFKVSLNLRAHDTLKFVFDQKFEINDINKICDEIFKDKEYSVKTVEVFSDAIYIISPSITEEEEKALLEKLDNLYKSENDSKDNEENNTEEEKTEESIFDKLEEGSKYELYHDSKVRIRDIVKPYFIPSIISAIIIVIYIAIRYRRLNDDNIFATICKTLGEMLVILLEVMSIIAIFRIPFSRALVPIIMFIIVVALCIRFAMFENELKKIDE